MSSIVYDASAQKVVSVFDSTGSAGEGKAVVSQLGYTSANLTAENYIGISDGAYSDGDSATIQITGSVDDAQTGLTAGQTYYVQSDGTLATTPDTISVIAGTAVSSTKLLIRADQDTISSGLDSSSAIALIDSAYIQARQTDIYRDSAFVTGIIDSAYVQARQTSGGSGTVDSAQVVSIINNNINSGFYKYKYTATSGQTVFADSDANGNVMSFDPNSTLVFYNGVLLDETTDYSASSNTVTLTSGADAGVSITVAKYGVGYTPPEYPWGGDRGVIAGGDTNTIEYVTISTPSNTTDFGDLSVSREAPAGCSNATYGLVGGGSDGATQYNSIDYFTISTPSNTSDFGDLTIIRKNPGALSDGTYGLWGGGYSNSGGQSYEDTIDYVTIASPSNASDFGNLTVARQYATGSVSNGTYGIWGGGRDVSVGHVNTIDYVTVASPSNASDFGDLTVSRWPSAAGDTTYGVFSSGSGTSTGNTIDYITMASPSNATDFGDLTNSTYQTASCGDNTYIIVAGGAAPTLSNVIQYITVATPSNATDFGDLSSSRASNTALSGNAS